MLHINATQIAINLLNSTLGMDDLPLEVYGRIATALVLLDTQEGEPFYSAIMDAYTYIGKDRAEIEKLLEEAETEDNENGNV